MKPAAACFVCQKVRGEIAIPGELIYRDELVQATHLFPNRQGSIYLGYLMIEPLRHAPELADLTVEEAQAIGLLMSRLGQALRRYSRRSMYMLLCWVIMCHICICI
jgi:histidine triad (HIT) family protein